MLAKRIIPCLDCDLSVPNGRTVKGVKFKNLVYAGEPAELAKRYSDEGADEIVFLDITASVDKRESMRDVVERTSKDIFVPLTVGGGIRTIEDMRNMLNAGADKVSINTAAIKNPQLINDGARQFGNQCIVVAIDAKRNYDILPGKIVVETKKGPCWFEAYTFGGREPTGIDVIKWAEEVEKRGAGEILLTSMDRDGMKIGIDVELTSEISERLNIPIIASGGIGTLAHFKEAFTDGKADAGLAASIFHFNEISIAEIKEYQKENNIPTRVIRD